MANTTKRYTSSAEIQEFWTNNIAPNYFDFDSVNNYRTGVFGYVNEVMSTSVMDTFHAVNVARREFYPVSAKYPQSIYKMAATQQLELPMATPATCRAILILYRDEIINNSTQSNGVYKCVIDKSAQIFADNMQFSLMYPIVILSNMSNGEWTHTIHYDKSNYNSLDKDEVSNYYITNTVTKQEGKDCLLLAVNLMQYKRETITQLVTTDSALQTVTMLFTFEGTLANFEVFYVEEPDSSKPVQLTKLMMGEVMTEQPFCYYRLLNSNMIELSFPKNIYFTPELNSEIYLDVYTSLGSGGNFDSFAGALSCTLESETYPYNNNMKMYGILNGSSVNGKDCPTLEAYTQKVQNAYSTNNTITTTNDLQILFDTMSDDPNNKVKFRKRRMDAFSRDYGAFVLLKDSTGNVVPTNTLTVKMRLNEFDLQNGLYEKAYIKPGAIFEYDPASDGSAIYTAKRAYDESTGLELKLTDDLSQYDLDNSRFLYTNPFLIAINLNPTLIGYYCNSIDTTKSVEYSYINDLSVVQFVGSGLKVYRNAIDGENFYKFSLNISPTTELDVATIIEIPSSQDNDDYYYRAEQNGKILSLNYVDSQIICTILYEDGSTDEIPVSSGVELVDGEYEYSTGYQLHFNVYDTFVAGDIIATLKVTDLGKVRACLNINNTLYNNGLYVPMVIEEYNEELNVYTLCGYISTDDVIDGETIVIERGILNADALEDESISIPSTNLQLEVVIFYNNDENNYSHKYSNFDYFKQHTMTNIYVDNSDEGVSLLEHIDFIKSSLDFIENDDLEDSSVLSDEDADEYLISIKEIPMVKATWIRSTKNFNYLINALILDYNKLKDIYSSLENEYTIDLKFYNTYGKSKFFRVGFRNQWSPLKSVNCSFKFGVYLTLMATHSTFLNDFRDYVKGAIESINSTASNQSIYILNLTHDIKNKFTEVGYVEYYGFDNYGCDVQKIEPIPTSELDAELLTSYVPEFINICSHIENGENIPNVDVEFLQHVE